MRKALRPQATVALIKSNTFITELRAAWVAPSRSLSCASLPASSRSALSTQLICSLISLTLVLAYASQNKSRRHFCFSSLKDWTQSAGVGDTIPASCVRSAEFGNGREAATRWQAGALVFAALLSSFSRRLDHFIENKVHKSPDIIC